MRDFHWIGPLGQFDPVVTMSIHIFYVVPSHAIFSVCFGASLALVFQIGRINRATPYSFYRVWLFVCVCNSLFLFHTFPPVISNGSLPKGERCDTATSFLPTEAAPASRDSTITHHWLTNTITHHWCPHNYSLRMPTTFLECFQSRCSVQQINVWLCF